MDLPKTLGALRRSETYTEHRLKHRSVKDELRENLICSLRSGAELFPGVQGYEATVTPQVINAILSKHNFILLGLRGQAKTRLIRLLTSTNGLRMWPVPRSATTLMCPSRNTRAT